MTRRNGKVNGKCKQCKKSQVKKDVERRVAEVEAMGQEDGLTDKDLVEAEESVAESEDKWCCMYKVMLLQDDFTCGEWAIALHGRVPVPLVVDEL
jgi:hypothetical protein